MKFSLKSKFFLTIDFFLIFNVVNIIFKNNMKSIILKSIVITSAVFLAACNRISTNSGFVWIGEVKEPIAYNNDVTQSKTGKACQQSILGIYVSGDSSIEAAKKAGGITRVASVEVEKNAKIVFGDACTIVTGE
jgi:hypothetical protein